MPNLTDLELQEAITKYSPKGLHQHPDCVRIAAEWLSAQKRIRTPRFNCYKHIIESWGGRYVSKDDVRVAAKLMGIDGTYPYLQISSMLIRPDHSRLINVPNAFKHPNYVGKYDTVYRSIEKLDR